MSSKRIQKTLSLLLYIVPILFFILCYFLIIASGEDIYQGAHTPPNLFADALAAFNHSARLADMFAWSVINFFDYSFFFGPDFFLRLLDVAAAFTCFYLASYVALRRRPHLTIKDACVFNALFLLVMLTSNGPTIYSGFSKIHNYLFIAFFTLLFIIVWLRYFLKKPLPAERFMVPIMFILSFLFGFASNITAIVFLLALPAYGIFLKISHRPPKLKPFLLSWRGASILGVLLALFLIYIVGPGLADYETSEAYLTVCDYLSLKEIFLDFGQSLIRIFKHDVYNFGKFLFPFFVVALPVSLYAVRLKLCGSLKFPKFTQEETDFLVASAIFIILHVLALSQIFYPTRLMFPIYLFSASIFIFIVGRFLRAQKTLRISEKTYTIAGITLVILSCFVFTVRAYFAVDYLKKVLPELERIKNSNESSLCVPKSIVESKFIPYFHFAQEDFLVDWALPETIYDKSVTICEE